MLQICFLGSLPSACFGGGHLNAAKNFGASLSSLLLLARKNVPEVPTLFPPRKHISC